MEHRHHRQAETPGRWLNRLARRWFVLHTALAGIAALLWLLLRAGSKPSRLAYPCQQAAISAAGLAFLLPVVAFVAAVGRTVLDWVRTRRGVALATIALTIMAVTLTRCGLSRTYTGPEDAPNEAYRAKLYHVTNCPEDPVDTRFAGLDSLMVLMGEDGLKLHRSDTVSTTSGPDGIIGASDVVIIKINYQWPARGGTNVDVLSGLIQWLVDHPDGFVGEVVVCENSQFNSADGFDRSENNAQTKSFSPHDAVTAFAQDYHVSHYAWTDIQHSAVSEYADGDMVDGYVVYDYDEDLDGRISYPKFQTEEGTYISLRDGIWDPSTDTYDRNRLKFINVPVLKSHASNYGMTGCIKHHMGTVTGSLDTNSHNGIAYGLLGAILAEVGPADLNILDCIWVNANPYDGPWTDYSGATRLNQLIASTDPVATDIWAAKNILIPAFVDNGYEPPWPSPSADPDDRSSHFRTYLDRSMSYMLAGGQRVTNKLENIDVITRSAAE